MRVAFNAWVDARAWRVRGGFQLHSFEDAIRAEFQARSLAAQYKTEQEIGALRSALESVEQQLSSIYGPEYERMTEISGRRTPLATLSSVAHVILFGLLVIVEMSFNLAVFSVISAPALYTGVMAVAVTIAVPVCAFTIGVWLRRWRGEWVRTAAKVATAILIILMALLGLSRVLEAMKASTNVPFAGSIFLWTNVLLFLAVALLNYLSHDPVEGFAEALRGFRRMQRMEATLRARIARLERRVQGDTRRERERQRYYAALYRTVYDRHTEGAYEVGGEAHTTIKEKEIDGTLRDDQ
jgi:hypothetical protein